MGSDVHSFVKENKCFLHRLRISIRNVYVAFLFFKGKSVLNVVDLFMKRLPFNFVHLIKAGPVIGNILV